MKDTKGIRILARRDPMSPKKWFELLQARADLLRESLREMTLTPLGEVQMQGQQHYTFKLESLLPRTVMCEDREFDFRTRGIFQAGDPSSILRPIQSSKGTVVGYDKYVLWGLTRNLQWLVAEVEVMFKLPSEQLPGNRDALRDTMVRIQAVSASDIYTFTGVEPREVWETIGESVKRWVDGRTRQLVEVTRIRNIIMLEEGQLADRRGQ